MAQWVAGFFLIGFQVIFSKTEALSFFRFASSHLFSFGQVLLIVSGNLSFLNYLTIVPAIACFDDSFLSKFCTRAYYQKWKLIVQSRLRNTKSGTFYIRMFFNISLVLLVAYLSIDPVRNLISPRQVSSHLLPPCLLPYPTKLSFSSPPSLPPHPSPILLPHSLVLSSFYCAGNEQVFR